MVELAEDDSLYVLVENPFQQSQAVATFTSWGVNLDHCRFITADTYSHWTRDCGPHSMFDGQVTWGIIDPVFEGYTWIPGGPYENYMNSRGYEEDDAVNVVQALEFDCPLHQFPAYLTGGNFMTDCHGLGYSNPYERSGSPVRSLLGLLCPADNNGGTLQVCHHRGMTRQAGDKRRRWKK